MDFQNAGPNKPMPLMSVANSFHIYVDESSKSSAYFGVGAIFCRRDAAEEIAEYVSGAVVAHRHRAD
jgi:hypothetical protein